jgi:hypothetical protein
LVMVSFRLRGLLGLGHMFWRLMPSVEATSSVH